MNRCRTFNAKLFKPFSVVPLTSNHMSRLLDFFSHPDKPNNLGFRFNDIFTWFDDQLESKHNYIQWFFPLHERSACFGDAPVLDIDDVVVFSELWVARRMQRKVLDRMLKFYGIKYSWFNNPKYDLFAPSGYIRVDWISEAGGYDHNYLRISRILASLRIFGNKRAAKKLFNYLMLQQERYKIISNGRMLFPETTVKYWKLAMDMSPEAAITKIGLAENYGTA